MSLKKIEVSVRDAKFAFDVLRDNNLAFSQDYSNEFMFKEQDDYDKAIEVFEENIIEIL